jgi:polar amino acid transport system substrate-binding protein
MARRCAPLFVVALALSMRAAPSSADPELAAMVPKEIRDLGTLTVPSQINYPPYEFYAADNKTATGLDIDLMSAVAERLELKVEFVNTTVSAIIPAVQNGRYPIAISALFDRVSDQPQADFVDYFVSGQRLLVRSGNQAGLTGWADLCGKRAMGTAGQPSLEVLEAQAKTCAASGKPALDVQTAPGTSVRLAALKSDRVDAIPVESAVGIYLARNNAADYQTVGSVVSRAPLGIVFQKGALAWARAVQAALDQMRAQGAYQQILEKWGVADAAIPRFTINGAADFHE